MYISRAPTSDFCAACGARCKPGGTQYAIHRDGFGKGPEVDICKGCGENELPTCEDLWAMIAARREGSEMDRYKAALTSVDALVGDA